MALVNGIAVTGDNLISTIETSNGLMPAEGPKCIPQSFDFSVQASYAVDLSQAQGESILDFVQSAFIDNSLNSETVSVLVVGSGQNVKIPAGGAGWMTLFCPNPPRFTVSSAGAGVVKIAWSNIPVTNNFVLGGVGSL
jgi:hypothetical protein